jgi:hypothetical protein
MEFRQAGTGDANGRGDGFKLDGAFEVGGNPSLDIGSQN